MEQVSSSCESGRSSQFAQSRIAVKASAVAGITNCPPFIFGRASVTFFLRIGKKVLPAARNWRAGDILSVERWIEAWS